MHETSVGSELDTKGLIQLQYKTPANVKVSDVWVVTVVDHDDYL